MQFFKYSDEIKSEWDEFVLSSSFGSIHQISAWKDFQIQIPGREKVLGFGVRENGKIVATTFCVEMNTGFLNKKWFYSARGPVFDPEKDSKAGELLFREASKVLQATGAIFWRFDPYFKKNRKSKFEIRNSHFAIQNYQPTDTLEIDLTKSDDDILAAMKRKGRYNIKLARKKGVKVIAIEKGSFKEKDLDDFWRLNTETTGRDNFSGHEKSYYSKFLHELKDHAVLFFAEYEGKRIASAITTICGEKSIYYFGASTSDREYRNLMAPYLLQFEMMQYSRSKGAKSYDFLGIAPLLPNGELDKKHDYAGITEFKLKFGGERKTYLPGREIIFSKLWYTLYRLAKKLKGIFKKI